jgi:negative regulator of sigma E activity
VNITPDERFQLIQRFYDGETLGNEAAIVEKMLETDEEAREILEGLRMLSDTIKVDVAKAVEQEDFSNYWAAIQERLPEGQLTVEPEHAVRPAEPIRQRPRLLRWLFGPALASAAAAALAVALFVPHQAPQPASFAVEIQQIDGFGSVVHVVEATSDTPMLITFTES